MTARRFVLKSRVNLEGQDEDGGRVLVDTYSATLCACNDTAWLLLQALREGAATDELVAKMTETFTVSEAAARGDVVDFLHRLEVMGLLDETE